MNWPRIAGALAVVLSALAVVFGAWWLLTEPGRARQRAAQAEASAADARAGQASARDAITVTEAAHAADDRSAALTQENTRAIQAAPGADAPLPPAVAAAGRRALCLRVAAAGDPRCRELLDARP